MAGRVRFFLFLFIALSHSAVLAQDFTIEKFHSDIVVSPDSSFTVKETIEVEFHRPRHGIYREIPYKYADELGKTIRTPLGVMSVTDGSGLKQKYKVKKAGNVINIRIGDASKFVEGRQTYIVSYKVSNALLYFNDHDELYWNVTGNGWPAAIKEASAIVVLAAEKKAMAPKTACYTGAYGSRESACSSQTFPNRAEFSSNRGLVSGEGFTVAYSWDKGIVAPPSSWNKFLWAVNLAENWVFFLPFVSLAYILNRWLRTGRDPKVAEAVAVMYGPPKHGERPLSPAEVGALMDERLDPRDITSTIVGLAVKGYIKIEESKEEGLVFDSTDYYLKKAKGPDASLSAFEKLLMEKVFAGALPGILVSELKNKFYLHIDTLKDTLYDGLVKDKYFLVSPEKVRKTYIGAGIAVSVFTLIALGIINFDLTGKAIAAGILAGLPILAFSRAMPAKTKAGASAYTEVLGFREFLGRAEKDRLERMGDKDLFSKFLPYAIALDVVENWAKAFEGIYQEPPDWYSSPRGFGVFSPYTFSRSLNSATSSLASSMFAAPRGSGTGGGGGGFGGGGFSGGGFGGGGGGSW